MQKLLICRYVLLICRKPDDEFAAEDQVEEIVNTNKSDKRNRTEEESFSDADIISSIRKRSRITLETSSLTSVLENAETVQIENSTESIKMSDRIVDVEESQTDDASVKRYNNARLLKEQETENVLEEKEKTHCHEENQTNVDEIMDITIESKAECELTKHVNAEEKQQDELPKNSTSCTNQIAEAAQRTLLMKGIINEEKELLQDNVEQEEMTAKEINYYESLFHNNVALND